MNILVSPPLPPALTSVLERNDLCTSGLVSQTHCTVQLNRHDDSFITSPTRGQKLTT